MKDRINVDFKGHIGDFRLDTRFEIPARGVTGLFGPSGCGKTTVLRCIAGLHHLRDGLCTVKGHNWQKDRQFLPAHRRPIGYVFQEASLFPHLSVKRNMLYGAPRRDGTANLVAFDDVVELLGLSGLLTRAPHNLSGGERQRVAIARALLSQPELLLMDEPLSALDRAAKDDILPFLERLHERLSLPILYVSHDMSEVERLADRLILMEGGRVQATGRLSDMQSDPTLPLVVRRDAAVSIDAIVKSHDVKDGLARLAVAGGTFLIPSKGEVQGHKRRLRIAAGDVSLVLSRPEDSSILNILPARIVAAREAGPHEITAILALGEDGSNGARLISRVTKRSWERLGLQEGARVHAQVKGVALAPKGSD